MYGKELDNLVGILFKIDERVAFKGKTTRDFFYRYQEPKIPFKEFAQCMLDIDSNLKFEEIDVIFSKLDSNADGMASAEEFGQLMDENKVMNDFKRYLVEFA